MEGLKKIIFLDIDGVLNYGKFFKSKSYRLNVDENGYDMVNQICKRNLFWVGLLCRLTKADVVLSSSWRYGWNPDGTVNYQKRGHQMDLTDKLFRRYGVNIISTTRKGSIQLKQKYTFDEDKWSKFINKWPNNFVDVIYSSKEERSSHLLSYARGTQILDWLERYESLVDFIILDDDIQDIEIYESLSKRIIRTSFYEEKGGFRIKHFIKALRILNG